VVDGTRIRSRQIGERVVVATGQQPHDRQADQAAQQRPDEEAADPVGLLPVVEADEHGSGGRGALDGGGDPFGEQERLVGQADDLLVLPAGGQGPAAGACSI
jgi:hypothetical protein